jgi:hypothetical protein
MSRWTMDVTFEEARAHLGMETQRQWHDRSIARTTPALLSLYSITTLTAHLLMEKGVSPLCWTAWYAKSHTTFSDAMAWEGLQKGSEAKPEATIRGVAPGS